jgi:hypothetical protein
MVHSEHVLPLSVRLYGASQTRVAPKYEPLWCISVSLYGASQTLVAPNNGLLWCIANTYCLYQWAYMVYGASQIRVAPKHEPLWCISVSLYGASQTLIAPNNGLLWCIANTCCLYISEPVWCITNTCCPYLWACQFRVIPAAPRKDCATFNKKNAATALVCGYGLSLCVCVCVCVCANQMCPLYTIWHVYLVAPLCMPFSSYLPCCPSLCLNV